MKIIYTRKMDEILVDDKSYEELNSHLWYLNNGYACRAWHNSDVNALNNNNIFMHRQIMNVAKGRIVDHIDRNPLNNQRSNLRECSISENCKNKNVVKRNTSGFPGVTWDKKVKKWKVNITANKKQIWLGYFLSFEDAVNARKEAEIKYFGDFHATNLILNEGIIQLSKNKKTEKISPINYKPNKNNTSGVIGVCFDKWSNKWKSYITINKKRIWLGTFENIEDAKKARLDAEVKYLGKIVEGNNIEQC